MATNRQQVSVEQLDLLCNTVREVIDEEGLTAERIFNCDETSITNGPRSRNVIAVRGSHTVWKKSAEASFHATALVCVSAAGEIVAPLLILPNKLVKRSVLSGCEIENLGLFGSPKGWVNPAMFTEWLGSFAASVPTSVKRPLLLIMDGCSSHLQLATIALANQIGVKILLLPPHASHLAQPLDVCVFRALKESLRDHVHELTATTGQVSIAKDDIPVLLSKAWPSITNSNIVSGFNNSGLFPADRAMMQKRLQLFQNGGVPNTVTPAEWVTHRGAVRREVLTLPPQQQQQQGRNKRRRSTVDIGGRILMKEIIVGLSSSSSAQNATTASSATSAVAAAAAAGVRIFSIIGTHEMRCKYVPHLLYICEM